MNKPRMTGSYVPNFHEGSRSEILADYLFSSWGTVTPARRQDDYGLDLYCTLSDRIGQRAVVRDYFVVQVKSDTEPWVFEHPESVRWLVEYPTPLFFACVDKKQQTVRVYHVMPRFAVWMLANRMARLELKPEDADDGHFVQWDYRESFSLSAPIIRATLGDLSNDDRMESLRNVFTDWVHLDRENCDLVRQGLLRFRMPVSYKVNQRPNIALMQEAGNAVPGREFLNRGISTWRKARSVSGASSPGSEIYPLLSEPPCWLITCERYTASNLITRRDGWRSASLLILGCLFESISTEHSGEEGASYQYTAIDRVQEALDNQQLVKNFYESARSK